MSRGMKGPFVNDLHSIDLLVVRRFSHLVIHQWSLCDDNSILQEWKMIERIADSISLDCSYFLNSTSHFEKKASLSRYNLWGTESVVTWLHSIDQGVLHDSARLETWNIQISDSCIDIQSIGCNRLRHLNILGISLSLIHLNVSAICLCKQNISRVWPCLFLHPKYGIKGIIRSFITMESFSKNSLWIGCFCDWKSVFLSLLLFKALLAVISLSLLV